MIFPLSRFFIIEQTGAVDFYCTPARLWCVPGMELPLPLRPPIVASITVFEPFLFPVVRPIQLAARPARLYLEAVLWARMGVSGIGGHFPPDDDAHGNCRLLL